MFATPKLEADDNDDALMDEDQENGEPSGSSVTAAMSGSGPAMPASAPPLPVSKREAEMNKKDRSLAEFLVMMDNYTPVVSLARSSVCTSWKKDVHGSGTRSWLSVIT